MTATFQMTFPINNPHTNPTLKECFVNTIIFIKYIMLIDFQKTRTNMSNKIKLLFKKKSASFTTKPICVDCSNTFFNAPNTIIIIIQDFCNLHVIIDGDLTYII